MASTYTTIQGDTLYIPLCFYSNRIGERYPSLIAFFTFHYVSILIGWFPLCWSSPASFTFHCVSILIWQSLRYLSKWGTFTFHYFNYDLHFFFRSAHVIYIPLCLYFNWCGAGGYPCWSRVYIPLCLYFNKDFHWPPPPRLRLHSIMSLF